MKNLIILEQRRFAFYDIPRNYQHILRMVLVTTESGIKNLPAELKPYFAEIYIVALEKSQHLFSEFTLDRKEIARIVEKELAIAGDPKNLNFVCNEEFNLLLIGSLRDQYHIPGTTESQFEFYRNKDLMKQRLAEKNLRVPRHLLLDTSRKQDEIEKYYQELNDLFSGRFVIKPLSGAGSIGTIIIREPADFMDLYPSLKETNLIFEAEEFIEGHVYHCDSLIQNGQILFSEVSEYLFQEILYPQGKADASLVLPYEDPLCKRILDFNTQVISSLGFIDGITHMEVFHTPGDEIVFIEAAARAGGIEIVPNYERAFGINLMAADLRIQAGEALEMKKAGIHTYCFSGRIPYIKGKVTSITKPDIKSRFTIHWKIKAGDVINHNSIAPVDFCASFWVENPDYQELREDFKYFRQFQPYQVELL